MYVVDRQPRLSLLVKEIFPIIFTFRLRATLIIILNRINAAHVVAVTALKDANLFLLWLKLSLLLFSFLLKWRHGLDILSLDQILKIDTVIISHPAMQECFILTDLVFSLNIRSNRGRGRQGLFRLLHFYHRFEYQLFQAAKAFVVLVAPALSVNLMDSATGLSPRSLRVLS